MDYFFTAQNKKPESGDLLISEPYLPDPNFERTVILLCDHDENGSFGYVLNKPSHSTFSQVINAVEDFDEPLYIGGPVEQNTLHFIHRSKKPLTEGKEVSPGLFWGGNFELLLQQITKKTIEPKDFRFFIGYSGWSAGQLEEELAAKSWIVYKQKNAAMLFDVSPDLLWKKILSELGGKYEMMSKYPMNPNMN